MKKFYVILAIGIPLGLSALFITSNALSSSFPMFRSEPLDEEQTIVETYESGLEFCKKNYENSGVFDKGEFENCIKSVEEWYEENKN